MFSFKSKKHKHSMLKNVMMMPAKGAITENMGKSLKFAGSQIEYMGKYMKKNPGLAVISSSVQKNPTGSAMALIGLGVAIFGIASFMRR